MWKSIWVIIGCSVVLSAGCRQDAGFVLKQPAASMSEQTIQLEDGDAWFTSSDGTGELLLAWALPGSDRGEPFYLLYVRIPDAEGTHLVDPEGLAVCGMFIQVNGRRKGRAELASGKVVVDDADSTRYRSGRIQLSCADGTSIEGCFEAVRGKRELAVFQKAHAGDLATLKGMGEPYVQLD